MPVYWESPAFVRVGGRIQTLDSRCSKFSPRLFVANESSDK